MIVNWKHHKLLIAKRIFYSTSGFLFLFNKKCKSIWPGDKGMVWNSTVIGWNLHSHLSKMNMMHGLLCFKKHMSWEYCHVYMNIFCMNLYLLNSVYMILGRQTSDFVSKNHSSGSNTKKKPWRLFFSDLDTQDYE